MDRHNSLHYNLDFDEYSRHHLDIVARGNYKDHNVHRGSLGIHEGDVDIQDADDTLHDQLHNVQGNILVKALSEPQKKS